ncbi:MAG: DUF6261 family protein [Prevotellaceae bacterium]|jgi:hypothetical protein|nr:DUF6261 family protein [Prevotellaceae bacterium]
MKKIITAHLSYYRNDGHCEYMINFRGRITEYPDISTLVEPLLPPFDAKLALEKALIDAMRKSDFTRPIAEADARVDRCIIGMREIINGSLRHFDSAIVDAAHSLKNRFDDFGRIEKKSYEEERLVVNLLLSDLNNAYSAKVAMLGLSSWVAELGTAETTFETLFAERQAETSRKPIGNLIDVRREIDPMYRQIVDRIEAAATLGTVITDDFIAALNADITYFNDHTHRRAKKDISEGDHTVVEPIDTQAYTGRPITVIPKVHYREKDKPTETLSLGSEFSVTYKNNINVGTAELTIHGKGAYKGQFTVTFNIARV